MCHGGCLCSITLFINTKSIFERLFSQKKYVFWINKIFAQLSSTQEFFHIHISVTINLKQICFVELRCASILFNCFKCPSAPAPQQLLSGGRLGSWLLQAWTAGPKGIGRLRVRGRASQSGDELTSWLQSGTGCGAQGAGGISRDAGLRDQN